MQNKISRLFNVEFDRTKRSWKNLDHKVDFTASSCWLYPWEVIEVLPGDHVESDVMCYVQTNPLQSPCLSSCDVKIEAFFIPTRLYVQSLDQNNLSIMFDGETPMPYITLPCGSYMGSFSPALSGTDPDVGLRVDPTSLLGMLGIPPYSAGSFDNRDVKGTIKINGIPFVGYFDIFRNFYMNPHDTNGVPFRCSRYSSPSRPGVKLVDQYVENSCFDAFINYVTLSSVDISDPSSIGSVGVDVISAFYKCFLPPISTTRIPLMNNQVFAPDPAAGTSFDTSDILHLGLLRRTYNDDYFSAFFANEFVDYQASTASVTVSNGKFSVQQLRFQNRMARFIDRNILSKFRYGGYLNAHFGVSLGDKICKPIYLGRRRFKLTFNEVISSVEGDAQTVSDNKSLGSRASLGSAFCDFGKDMFHLDSSEYGYIIYMFSIIPNVTYWQGLEKLWRKTKLSDLYVPEFDGYGYEDVSYLEYNAYRPYFGDTSLNTGFKANDIGVVKHPAFMEYMISYDKVKGAFQTDTFYSNWFFNRTFTDQLFQDPTSGQNPPSFPPQLSTYMYPEAFDSIFPVQVELDNYQVHCRLKCRIKRCMSAQILPSL